jgi:hypothetical protein
MDQLEASSPPQTSSYYERGLKRIKFLVLTPSKAIISVQAPIISRNF